MESFTNPGAIPNPPQGDPSMKKFKVAILAFLKDEDGATMLEYALMAALIAAACVVAVTAFGTAVSEQFNVVAGGF